MESIAIKSDNTGRPEVSSISCAASVGSVKVKFQGGARLENPDVTMEVIISVILSTLNTPLITMLLYVVIPAGCTISSQSTLIEL